MITTSMDEVIKKIEDLYVTVRYKYIMQTSNDYITFNIYKNSKVYPFTPSQIKQHLKHKNTYGVFCYSKTKFVTFDVDYVDRNQAKIIVLNLYNVLNHLGIPSEKIFSSWSGNKGYHVSIFFNKDIELKVIKRFYSIVTELVEESLEKNLGFSWSGQIELRPQKDLGVKLPLGINKKNKNRQKAICWFVDVYNKFNPITVTEHFISGHHLHNNPV